MTKKIYIKSFGCQMNVRDSEVVKGLLAAEGYKLVDDPKVADVVLFNTCSVRQHAEDKVWSELGRFGRRETRDARRKTKLSVPVLGVIGCMAQNYKEEVFKRAPNVDIVCGPSEIDNIALYLEEALRKDENVLAIGERRRKEAIYHTGFREDQDHAYVVISEGCDNFCSYCVVPHVRGRLRHRSPGEILREVVEAVGAGIRNVTLLGQNVNSYESSAVSHQSSARFVELLRRVCEIEGLKSVSFITCHPKDTKRELFELMAEQPVIRPYLHMPVQSGSDRILKLMNRGYASSDYLDIVDRYRAIVYNGQLSTDIIVGFPSETDEEFEETRELLERVRFDTAYLFKYSPRPHTKAALMKDDVPDKVKKQRHAALLVLQKKISAQLKEHKRDS